MDRGVAWTWGSVHPDVLVGVAALGALYAWSWTRRSTRPEGWRVASFLAGLAAIALALNGPLHDLSDNNLFSAHMIQHLVLTLAVPPLLLLGAPPWMVDALLAPLLARRASARLVRTVTRPLPAFALYAVVLVLWHLPGPYGAALVSHRWHIVQHLTLMAASVLGWWPVLSPSARLPRLHPGAQILYLFVFGMPMTIVAAMITGAEDLLYPFYATTPRVFDLTPLADQRLGGILMWVPAGLIPLVAFTVVYFRWAAAEREEDEDHDMGGVVGMGGLEGPPKPPGARRAPA